MSESEAQRYFLRSLSCWSHKTLESNMSHRLTRIEGLFRVRVTGASYRSSYRSFAVTPSISMLSHVFVRLSRWRGALGGAGWVKIALLGLWACATTLA